MDPNLWLKGFPIPITHAYPTVSSSYHRQNFSKAVPVSSPDYTKLKNELSASEDKLVVVKAELERLQRGRDTDRMRQSVNTENLLKLDKELTRLKNAKASKQLCGALKTAQLVVNGVTAACNEVGVKESDIISRDFLIEELKQKLSTERELNAALESQLREEREEKEKMRTANLAQNRRIEILHQMILNCQNVARILGTTVIDTNQESIRLGISYRSLLSETGDESELDKLEYAGVGCAVDLEELSEKCTTASGQSDSECQDKDEDLPAVFWDAVSMISPEEMAELEELELELIA